MEVATPEPYRGVEAFIVASLFEDEAVADHSTDQVINGRHRMYYAWRSGATHLPVQSASVSGWSHSLFADLGHTVLKLQTVDCAFLFEYAGQCEAWRRRRGADVEFIDGLADAREVAEDFLDAVADDVAKVDLAPRVLARS